MELTKSELEVMTVLWDADRPLSRSDILKNSGQKTWKDSSVHILLNGLLAKEAIYEAGFARSGKTFGRVFAPKISCKEYYSGTVFHSPGEKRLPQLFSALIDSDGLTPELLAQFKEMLAEREKDFKKK